MKIQRSSISAILSLVFLCALSSAPGRAAVSNDSAPPEDVQELSKIPKKPTAPPPVAQPHIVNAFQCSRQFIYRGKALDCDSFVRRDAENLRPILSLVPEAEAELDAYQAGRRSIQNAAYYTSAGLAIALLGFFIHHPPIDNGTITNGGWLMLGGLALSTVSYTYGITAMKSNEYHISNAIQRYNAARPGDPIQLQFSTGFSF